MNNKKLYMLFALFFFGLGIIAQTNKYPAIDWKTVVIQGDKCAWDANTVHTMSIVEANKDGYKYWAYYGLDHYNDHDKHVRKSGLARSNDLENWEKYAYNPIINNNCRWPTVVYKNDVFYMFYAEYNHEFGSQIVMETSTNGLDFENKTVVVPYAEGEQNQNPFIYFNENDSNFYLFYYNGTERAKTDKTWNIMVKKNKDVHKLKEIKSKTVISAKETIAAPSIAFYKGTYYLLVEEFNDSKAMDRWVTNAFYSNKVDDGFKRVSNNPILWDNDACAFQYIFDNKLYVTFSHALNTEKSIWNLKMIKLK